MLHQRTVGSVFTDINLLCIILNSGLQARLLEFTLPDYIFIAPYTKEQRKDLVKKGLLYKFLLTYGCLLMIVICPVVIFAISHGGATQIVLCITEAVIFLTMVYSGRFLIYISKVDIGVAVFIGCVIAFQFALFAGVSASESELIDIILIFAIIISAIIVIMICRRRYYEPMVGYQADYEQSREINKKRKQII